MEIKGISEKLISSFSPRISPLSQRLQETALDHAALIYNPLWHLVFFLLKPSVTAVRFAIPINLSFHRAGIVIGVPTHDSGPALGHVVFL